MFRSVFSEKSRKCNLQIQITLFLFYITAEFYGLFDVATKAGIEGETATFDGTLESYGVGEGTYVEVPVLGGMTTRQMAGLAGDSVADPINHPDYKTKNTIAKTINNKAEVLRKKEEKEEGDKEIK